MLPFAAPPPDVSPARLFRLLTQRHPERPIAYRIPGAEGFALSVRAVPAPFLASLFDGEGGEGEGGGGEGADLSASRVSAALLVAALRCDDAPAFPTTAALGALPTPIVDALWGEVMGALGAVSPSYHLSDVRAWMRVLEEGAIDGANVHRAFALAGCIDSGASHVVSRPDRFWGCAMTDLLDGHWMAFRAARAAYLRAIEASTPLSQRRAPPR